MFTTYAENWGNHYALPKPKTPEEQQKEKERQAQLGLPTFRYHPNPLETGAFEESADGVACDCCGKTTHIYYTEMFTSGFAVAISTIPAGRTRVTRLSFERKAAACSRVRTGICIPAETVYLILSRKVSRIYTCIR